MDSYSRYAFVQLLSLHIIILRSIHVVACAHKRFSPLPYWLTFHCMDVSVRLSTYLRTDTCGLSSSGLLQTQLLWIFVYEFLYGRLLSFLLGKCVVVKWLDHIVGVCQIFKKLPRMHPGWCGSVDWALSCDPKGHQFDSRSGHMPGLWLGPQLAACERQPMFLSHIDLSVPLSFPFPVSKN